MSFRSPHRNRFLAASTSTGIDLPCSNRPLADTWSRSYRSPSRRRQLPPIPIPWLWPSGEPRETRVTPPQPGRDIPIDFRHSPTGVDRSRDDKVTRPLSSRAAACATPSPRAIVMHVDLRSSARLLILTRLQTDRRRVQVRKSDVVSAQRCRPHHEIMNRHSRSRLTPESHPRLRRHLLFPGVMRGGRLNGSC